MITATGTASALATIASQRTVAAVSLDAADTLFAASRLWASVEPFASSHGIDRTTWTTAADHAGRAGMWPTDSPDQATRQVKWSAFFSFGLESVLATPADDLVDAAARAMTDPSTYELFPDSTICLQRLRLLELPVAVVTNFDLLLYDILDFLGIRDLIDAVVTSVEIGHNKPAPALFAEAARRIEARIDDVVHVGDSLLCDVGGAMSSGMTPVLLDRAGRLPAAVHVIRSLDDL